MAGFGGKQAWLAVRALDAGAVIEALDLRDLGEVPWRQGLDLAHFTDDRVVVTPPLTGARDERWVLVAGRLLMQPPDLVTLSARLGTEVQYFATDRVTEMHRWQRAAKGELVRAFGYVGRTGEVTSWFGDPDPAERDAGLPGVLDEETTVLVSENDVLRVAGAWSVDPSTLSGPAPGPLHMAAAKHAAEEGED
jgi:hypothetical protein